MSVTDAKPHVVVFCSSDALFDILYKAHNIYRTGDKDHAIKKKLSRQYKQNNQNGYKASFMCLLTLPLSKK